MSGYITVNLPKVVTYLCDTWGKVCHLQLVTWTVTSTLEGYQILFSTYFRYSHGPEKFIHTERILISPGGRGYRGMVRKGTVKSVCTLLRSYSTLSLLITITLLFWFATSEVPWVDNSLYRSQINSFFVRPVTTCLVFMDVTFTVLRTHSFW